MSHDNYDDDQETTSLVLRLSRLETDRTHKRQQMESLLIQKFEIQRSMDELAQQLELLDEEIDLLEQQQQVASHETLTPQTLRRSVFTQPTQADEILTDPPRNDKTMDSTRIRQPEEEDDDSNDYLTEPMTMMTSNSPSRLPLESEQQTIVATNSIMAIQNKTNPHSVLQPLPSTMNNSSIPLQNINQSSKLPVASTAKTTTTSSGTRSLDAYFGIQNQAKTNTSHQESETSILVTRLLQETFRINSFREHQREIILATLAGHDVFVIMRTGGGKSLTYQLPALLEGRHSPTKKITLVVSPLLSLIQDQEEQMNQFCPGSAVSFTSGMGVSEHAQRWNRVRDPNAGVCLVLVTPEKISKSNKLCAELEKLNLAGRLGRFVIDEAHWYVSRVKNDACSFCYFDL
jgi:ATP-dependent helicase YprA (DUF1998 family)